LVTASTIAVIAALVVAGVNTLAAAVGGVRWWQVEPSRAFWFLARAGQAAAVLFAGVCGVLALTGYRPAEGLFWLYALLPVAISFIAEQLRIASAEQVLDRRGLENAQAVGRLEERAQRSVVLEIVRREMGIVAVAAGVVAFLALRGSLVA
jgi:hypothetical protein